MLVSIRPLYGSSFIGTGMTKNTSTGNFFWSLILSRFEANPTLKTKAGSGWDALFEETPEKERVDYKGKDKSSRASFHYNFYSSERLWHLLQNVYMEGRSSARRVTRQAVDPAFAHQEIDKVLHVEGSGSWDNAHGSYMWSTAEERIFCWILAKSGLGSWTNNYAMCDEYANSSSKDTLTVEEIAWYMRVTEFGSTWNTAMATLASTVASIIKYGDPAGPERGYYASTAQLMEIVAAWEATLKHLKHVWEKGAIPSVDALANAIRYAQRVVHCPDSLTEMDLTAANPYVKELSVISNELGSDDYHSKVMTASTETSDNMQEAARLFKQLLAVNITGKKLIKNRGGKARIASKLPYKRVAANSYSLVPVLNVDASGIKCIDPDISISETTGQIINVNSSVTAVLQQIINEGVGRLKSLLDQMRIDREQQNGLYAQVNEDSLKAIVTTINGFPKEALVDYLLEDGFILPSELHIESSGFSLDSRDAYIKDRMALNALLGIGGVIEDLGVLTLIKIITQDLDLSGRKLGDLWLPPVEKQAASSSGVDASESSGRCFGVDDSFLYEKKTSGVFKELVNNALDVTVYVPMKRMKDDGSGTYIDTDSGIPQRIYTPLKNMYGIVNPQIMVSVDPDMVSQLNEFATAWNYLKTGFVEKTDCFSVTMDFVRSYLGAAKAAFETFAKAVLTANGVHKKLGDSTESKVEYNVAVLKTCLSAYRAIRGLLVPELAKMEDKVIEYAKELCEEKKLSFYMELQKYYSFN